MDARTTLFLEFRSDLFLFLKRRVWRIEDAEDLLQDIFVRLWRCDSTLQIEKPRSFIFTIAYNTLINHYTKIERENSFVIISDDAVSEWDAEPTEVVPDNVGERLSLEQQINRALSQLPPRQAAVILAHERDGMSYEETAEFLGLSPLTVKKYLFRAKSYVHRLDWER